LVIIHLLLANMKSIAHTCLLSIITMRDDNNIFTKSLKMYWYKLYIKKSLFTQFIREQKETY